MIKHFDGRLPAPNSIKTGTEKAILDILSNNAAKVAENWPDDVREFVLKRIAGDKKWKTFLELLKHLQEEGRPYKRRNSLP